MGYTPYSHREETVPVKHDTSNTLVEVLQVILIAFLIRIVMIKSGVIFINIPFVDPVVRSFLAYLGF